MEHSYILKHSEYWTAQYTVWNTLFTCNDSAELEELWEVSLQKNPQ